MPAFDRNLVPLPVATVADATAANAVAAAGANPTKAEYDAVVTLANELKTRLNALNAALRAAGVIS